MTNKTDNKANKTKNKMNKAEMKKAKGGQRGRMEHQLGYFGGILHTFCVSSSTSIVKGEAGGVTCQGDDTVARRS